MAGARVGARAQLGQYVRRGQDRSSAGDLGPEISRRAGAQCADQHPNLEREFPATRTGPEERMPQIDDDAPFPRHRALARAKQIKVATEESKRIDKAASDGPKPLSSRSETGTGQESHHEMVIGYFCGRKFLASRNLQRMTHASILAFICSR
jgi:hypothetical protein